MCISPVITVGRDQYSISIPEPHYIILASTGISLRGVHQEVLDTEHSHSICASHKYCDMANTRCGIRGWMKVANVDMTDTV